TGEPNQSAAATQAITLFFRLLIRSVAATACAFYAGPDPIDKRSDQQSTNRRLQARRVFADSEHAVTAHHNPIEQHRFLEPGKAAEHRSDQLAVRQHFARDLSIPRFIRPHEGY